MELFRICRCECGLNNFKIFYLEIIKQTKEEKIVKKLILIGLFILGLLILFFFIFRKSTEEKIIGKWKHPNSQSFITFNSDFVGEGKQRKFIVDNWESTKLDSSIITSGYKIKNTEFTATGEWWTYPTGGSEMLVLSFDEPVLKWKVESWIISLDENKFCLQKNRGLFPTGSFYDICFDKMPNN